MTDNFNTPWVTDKDKSDAETVAGSSGWGKDEKSDSDELIKSGW